MGDIGIRAMNGSMKVITGQQARRPYFLVRIASILSAASLWRAGMT